MWDRPLACPNDQNTIITGAPRRRNAPGALDLRLAGPSDQPSRRGRRNSLGPCSGHRRGQGPLSQAIYRTILRSGRRRHSVARRRRASGAEGLDRTYPTGSGAWSPGEDAGAGSGDSRHRGRRSVFPGIMPFCSHCGAVLAKDSAGCAKCGRPAQAGPGVERHMVTTAFELEGFRVVRNLGGGTRDYRAIAIDPWHDGGGLADVGGREHHIAN